MPKGGRSVHGDVFFVPERNVISRSLGARCRGNQEHSRRDVVEGAHLNSDYEVRVASTNTPICPK